MMAAVPTADVVVTNPTHFAIALKYAQGEQNAPVVVAKGVDNVALNIRTIANDNEIPIVENPPLARALYKTCDLDDEIPIEHYKAVAEIIGYVMRLKKNNRENLYLWLLTKTIGIPDQNVSSLAPTPGK